MIRPITYLFPLLKSISILLRPFPCHCSHDKNFPVLRKIPFHSRLVPGPHPFPRCVSRIPSRRVLQSLSVRDPPSSLKNTKTFPFLVEFLSRVLQTLQCLDTTTKVQISESRHLHRDNECIKSYLK